MAGIFDTLLNASPLAPQNDGTPSMDHLDLLHQIIMGANPAFAQAQQGPGQSPFSPGMAPMDPSGQTSPIPPPPPADPNSYLMSSQAPAGAASSTPDATPQAAPITVTGHAPTSSGDPTEGDPNAPVAPPMHKDSLIHRILGAVQDGYREASGLEPLYRQRTIRNNIANILVGYKNDPMGTINKIAAYDPKLAGEYFQHLQTAQYHQEMMRLRGDSNATAREKVDIGQTKYLNGAISSMIAGGNPTAANWPTIRDAARAAVAASGGKTDFDIPDQFDPTALASIMHISDPVKAQEMQKLGQARLTETGRHNLQDENIGRTKAGAMVVSAHAQGSRAATAASEAPSVIGKNNAQAGAATSTTDRNYGRNGTIQTGAKSRGRPIPQLGGGATPVGAPVQQGPHVYQRMSDGTAKLIR